MGALKALPTPRSSRYVRATVRGLKCAGGTLMMIVATILGFSAAWEAGAREGWSGFRLDRLSGGGTAMLYGVGSPFVVLLAVLIARSGRAARPVEGGGIVVALLGVILGTHGMVVANKDPAGLPFIVVALLLFVASTMMLSSRTASR